MADIHTIKFQPSALSAFGVLQAEKRTPVIQGDFVYGINNQIWLYSYVFTITDAATDPVYGDYYSNNNATFFVIWSSGTTLVAYGSGAPAASGNLVKISGSGTTPIAFSAFTTQAGVVSGTGAAIDTDAQRLRIQCGTGSANYSYINTRRPIKYRAGQGMEWEDTCVFGTGAANNLQFAGVGTIINNAIYDGYGFCTDPTNSGAFSIVHFNRGTPAYTAQTAWNQNTVSVSPFIYDPTKGTPLRISYPYLGFGDILLYIQNSDTGEWVLVHIIKYANTSASTQLSNPSLQGLFYQLNNGNTTNKIMYVGSFAGFISGGQSYIGNPKNRVKNSKSGITTETNIVSIRNANSYNGVYNRGLIRLTNISVSSSAASGVASFDITMNPTLGGTPAFAALDGTSSGNGVTITAGMSIASKDTAGTTITGGRVIFGITVDNPNTDIIDLTPYELFIAPGEIVSISGTSSNASEMGVTVNFTEDI